MNMEFFLAGLLGGSFLGMIHSFSLLREIWEHLFDGWQHWSIVVLALLMSVGWWSLAVFFVVKYILQ